MEWRFAVADASWLNGRIQAQDVIARYPHTVLLRLTPERAERLAAEAPAGLWHFTDDPHIWVNGNPVAVPAGTPHLGDHPHTLLRFLGPLTVAWRELLNHHGIDILFWCPPWGACCRLPEGWDGHRLQQALPFLAGARDYLAKHCTRGIPEPVETLRRRTGLPPAVTDLVCFSAERRETLARDIDRLGGKVLARSRSKLRIQGLPPERLRPLAGVKLADPARMPLLAASPLAEAVGLEAPARATPRYRGRGEIVAVADTGLDQGSTDPERLHPDFHGRIRRLLSRPIDPSWDEFVDNPRGDDGAADRVSGHGTHVAGLVAGTGAAGGGRFPGLAPEAQLVFQALEQDTRTKAAYRDRLPPGHYLSGRPLDLRELFRQAREFGARIHVNAWGDPVSGRYTDDCWECDDFLHRHPDALVIFAAGNSGSDRDGDREIDPGSLYAPASAKNVLAVGATEGPVLGSGLRAGWGALDPEDRRFRHPADRRDPVSGDIDHLALFTAVGPTPDGRIKPELCAPGTNLAAPRSSLIRGRGWGLASPLPYYMYNGGTSMAAAVVAGATAVLRQAWREARGAPPAGPTLKALMILGAAPLRRRDGRGSEPPEHAGWGRLNLAPLLPDHPRAPRWLKEQEPGLWSGELRSHPLRLHRPGRLRAVLAWYDAPGERLINDLDLVLMGADGPLAWGNHPPGETGEPDRRNTIEVIDIALPPGDYRLEVRAHNIPAPPQGYALAWFPFQAKAEGIPVRHLKGIGRHYGARLAKKGVLDLAELLQGRERLGDLLESNTWTTTRLQARLTLLADFDPSALPAGLDPATPLAHWLIGSPQDEPGWQATREHLLPLIEVFDRGALKRIPLGALGY